MGTLWYTQGLLRNIVDPNATHDLEDIPRVVGGGSCT